MHILHIYVLYGLWWAIFCPMALAEPSHHLDDLHQKALRQPHLEALAHQYKSLSHKASQHQYPAYPMAGIISMGPQNQYLSVSQKLTPRYSLTAKAFAHKQNKTEAMIRAAKRQILQGLIMLYATIFALERKLHYTLEYQDFLQSLAMARTKGFAATGNQAWIMTQKEQIRVRLERLELERQMDKAQRDLMSLVGDLTTQLTFGNHQLPEPQISHAMLKDIAAEIHSNKPSYPVALQPDIHELRFLKTQSQLGQWYRNTGWQIQAQQRLRGADPSPPWILSVQVSIPLWRQQNSARYLALHEESLSHASLLEAKHQDLTAEILALSFAAESYEKSLHEYRLSLIPLLEHQFTTTQRGYGAQRNSLVELMAHKKSLYDAHHQYYTTFMKLTGSLSKIQMLTGRKVAQFFGRSHR